MDAAKKHYKRVQDQKPDDGQLVPLGRIAEEIAAEGLGESHEKRLAVSG